MGDTEIPKFTPKHRKSEKLILNFALLQISIAAKSNPTFVNLSLTSVEPTDLFSFCKYVGIVTSILTKYF